MMIFFRIIGRFIRILAVISHAHLLTRNPQIRGKRLARTLPKLGPSFIKLGQMLSTRPDIVGQEVADALSYLQDRLPPFAFAKVKHTIETAYDAPLNQLFSSFEETPIAAASIAQVHKATTIEGKEVAVKILRPHIEKAFALDLAIFRFIARLATICMPSTKRLRLLDVVATLSRSVAFELDLSFEAAAASELKENLAHDPHIVIPAIEWKYTTHNILTTERISGIPIHHIDEAEHSYDRTILAKTLAISFFQQAYEYGFFHADLHPGNILVLEDNKIALLDFGIMGRLPYHDRIYVAEILRGFIQRDYTHVAKVHIDAGYVPENTSVAEFAQACRAIGEPIVGLPVDQVSIARLLATLFKTTKDFNMHTQPQLLLLQKSMLLVEGVGTLLNPNINMWELAEPWIEQWAKKHLGMEARLKHKLQQYNTSLQRIPTIIDRVDSITKDVQQHRLRRNYNNLFWQRAILLALIVWSIISLFLLLH